MFERVSEQLEVVAGGEVDVYQLRTFRRSKPNPFRVSPFIEWRRAFMGRHTFGSILHSTHCVPFYPSLSFAMVQLPRESEFSNNPELKRNKLITF